MNATARTARPTTARFWVVSAHLGLLGTRETQDAADWLAIVASVHTGRTVHVHDRLDELGA